MKIAFFLACVMNVGYYWFRDKIVLKMYSAREATATEAPELHSIVRELTARAGLPMPKVYIVPGDTPNAFATGRNPNHAAVAATEGILYLSFIMDKIMLRCIIQFFTVKTEINL